MRIHIVTSWSNEGHKTYGRQFIDAFQKHCPYEVMVVTDHGIHSRDDWKELVRAMPGTAKNSGYVYGAYKWAHKVWALNMALEELDSDYMVWIDGDVELFKDIGEAEFESLLRGYDLTFLGRPWAYASETGFVGFNLTNPTVHDLIREMKTHYESGDVYKEKNWGDGYTFDIMRQRYAGRLIEHDLCAAAGLTSGLSVFNYSALGKWMKHHKGPIGKRTRYA